MINNSVAVSRVIESEAAKRAAAVKRAMEERQAKVGELCPRVAELERDIKNIALDLSNKIIASPADASALISLANDMIAAKRGEIESELVSKGLPADFTAPQYICPECRDTGYAGGAVCACMRQAIINSRFKNCGVNPDQNFEAFSFEHQRDPKCRKAMHKIYDYCLAYADSFPNNEQGDMLFIGPPGVGKTYLLNCIGGRVLSGGHSVLKINAHRLIQTVLDSFRSEAEDRPDFVMPELLIIDDLGAEPMIDNVTIESLLSIICARQDENRPTLFATNHDTDELAQRYGGRIVSRLLAPKTVKVITVNTDNVRLSV